MHRYTFVRGAAALGVLVLAACAAPTQPATPAQSVAAGGASASAVTSPASQPSAGAEPSVISSVAPSGASSAAASAEPSAAASAEPSIAPSVESSAVASEAPVPSLPAAVASVQFSGVSFAYDPAVVGTPTGRTQPPMDYFADRLPAFTEFTFANPAYTGGFPGWLRVFNVADFDALPESYRETMRLREPMPPLHAARILNVQRAELPFANGTGARSVVFYTQNATPLANDMLFYSYQGLTADGQRYVSLALPVSSALLPESVQAVLAGSFPAVPYDPANPDAFNAAIQAFNEQMSAALDALPADAFSPSLAQLDALVQSLQVSQP